MKNYITFLLLITIFFGCNHKKEISSINPENWSKRKIKITQKENLEYGKSYLSVYSQIYSASEHRTHNLTAMASLRNISDKDTIYLLKAEYFDTKGNSIRKYFDYPIYLAPLETTEIIIDETDILGGTGSNFIIEWKVPLDCPAPLFEGIMSSTLGQQGLSFTTQAKQIN